MTAILRKRLSGGIWQGVAPASDRPPLLHLRHADDIVASPEVAPDDDGEGWAVTFRLPVERIADGVQTFVIEDAETGEALASETVIAGDGSQSDLRAEVDLLRAELDMLKRAFRRHVSGD